MAVDPLDALRLPEHVAESPDPPFARALRRRIEALLAPSPPPDATVAPAVQAVTPYLCVHDGHAAIAWYRDAFGAVLEGEIIPMFDDKVGHAELGIAGTRIMLSDEWPDGGVFSPRSRGGTSTSFVLTVPDVDAVFARAIALGAEQERPVADQEYGMRSGWLVDPFGHRWNVGTPLDAIERAGDDVPVLEVTRGDAVSSTATHSAHDEAPFRADLWNEVGYFTIAVPDPVRSRTFFNALFGWELPEPQATPDGHVGMHNASTRIPMGLHDAIEGERPVHLYFRVHDLDAAIARALELGGSLVSRDRWRSGGTAVVRDDQGFEFDLWEPAEGY